MSLTKDQKQKIKEKIQNCVKVKDLIAVLMKLDPDMPVATVGHFGEAHLHKSVNFSVSQAYITASGSWRDENRESIHVLHFSEPYDIGPDPD